MKGLRQNILPFFVGLVLALFAGTFYGNHDLELENFHGRSGENSIDTASPGQVLGLPASGVYVSQPAFQQAVFRIQQAESFCGAQGGSTANVLCCSAGFHIEPANSQKELQSEFPARQSFRYPKDYYIYVLERMLC